MMSREPAKRKQYSETKVVTVIGPETSISGEVTAKGTIRVEGNVTGHIRTDDTIVVHEDGKVKADLVAGQIIISGEVKGNVFALDRIEVTAKGRVYGDITAPRIAIAEGVIFEGKCSMPAPGQPMPPPPGTKSAAEPRQLPERPAAPSRPQSPAPPAQPGEPPRGES